MPLGNAPAQLVKLILHDLQSRIAAGALRNLHPLTQAVIAIRGRQLKPVGVLGYGENLACFVVGVISNTLLCQPFGLGDAYLATLPIKGVARDGASRIRHADDPIGCVVTVAGLSSQSVGDAEQPASIIVAVTLGGAAECILYAEQLTVEVIAVGCDAPFTIRDRQGLAVAVADCCHSNAFRTGHSHAAVGRVIAVQRHIAKRIRLLKHAPKGVILCCLALV